MIAKDTGIMKSPDDEKIRCGSSCGYRRAGALLSMFIASSEIIAYEDLGPEAIYKLEVTDFPAIVAYDAYGKSVYGFESRV